MLRHDHKASVSFLLQVSSNAGRDLPLLRSQGGMVGKEIRNLEELLTGTTAAAAEELNRFDCDVQNVHSITVRVSFTLKGPPFFSSRYLWAL